jgi:EAL domain-containing protein (putative c-di-GMP-specific phosphodiesterase class I)
VCEQLAEWQRAHLPLLPVSVNLSVRQFEQPGLADTVAEIVRAAGIESRLVHFEITETGAMQTSEQNLGALHALRHLGCRILVDDFGTGYSSLSYLKHLPIDTLKIDRAFVRDMAADANDAAIVSAIVGIGKSLGLHLVAEGIESIEQLECLRTLGCGAGQGFFFSPPIAADRCAVLLEELRTQRSEDATRRMRVLEPVESQTVS